RFRVHFSSFPTARPAPRDLTWSPTRRSSDLPPRTSAAAGRRAARTRVRDRSRRRHVRALGGPWPPAAEAAVKSFLVVSPYGSEYGPRQTLEHVVRAVVLAGFRPVCVVRSQGAVVPALYAL